MYVYVYIFILCLYIYICIYIYTPGTYRKVDAALEARTPVRQQVQTRLFRQWYWALKGYLSWLLYWVTRESQLGECKKGIKFSFAMRKMKKKKKEKKTKNAENDFIGWDKINEKDLRNDEIFFCCVFAIFWRAVTIFYILKLGHVCYYTCIYVYTCAITEEEIVIATIRVWRAVVAPTFVCYAPLYLYVCVYIYWRPYILVWTCMHTNIHMRIVCIDSIVYICLHAYT